MKTAHDLFLSEETRDQKARRSVTEILAEDDADLERLAELSKTTISYTKLSRLKSNCAWLMLHKRATVGSSIAVTACLAGGLFFVQSLFMDDAISQVTTTVAAEKSEPKPKETVASEIKLPEIPQTKIPDQNATSEGLQTYAHMEDAGKELLNNDIRFPSLPILTPITEVQVRDYLENQKVDTQPVTVVGAVAVPLNKVNIHEESIETPAATTSASDFIDQFGFGTESKDEITPMTTEDIGDVDEENVPVNVVPIPVSKPQADTPSTVEERADIRYQIIDREGERAGFRRMKDKNPDTTQWFLVIEAIDASGNPTPMPVMSMDTGEVKVVTKWAIQVPEKDFMKFSDEKKKTGKIADTTVGTAPTNKTEPKWSVELTGNMLTEWE